MNLPDGCYQVRYNGICAGFEVAGGKVVRCAPVLRRRLDFFATKAKRITIKNELQRNV